MENKKSGKGLIITLVVLLIAFAACAVLLFTGVVKSPMVKCEEKVVEKTSTKTDDDAKKSSTTEKTADERYKEYVSNLASEIKAYYNNSKGRTTSLSSYASDSFKVYYDVYSGFGSYRLSISNNLELLMDASNPNNEELYSKYKLADNVVAYFVKHLGNGVPSTLYYITSDAKLHSIEVETTLSQGSKDFTAKDLDKKNIVNIEQATFVDAGGEDVLFIDIDGNAIGR
ncbi:MAG: hypothetical protein IJH20_03465 [Bacilli bacterium]|nr:hypothetical protein [Bacilli bacterium]